MQLYETTLPGGAWLRGWVRDATESMPDFNVRPAVLVLPGGGYAHCSVREGDPVAARFLAAGYQVFLLNYTVAEDPARAPLGYAPLTDVARALLHLDPAVALAVARLPLFAQGFGWVCPAALGFAVGLAMRSLRRWRPAP